MRKRELKRKFQERWEEFQKQAIYVLTSPVRFLRFMCFAIGAVVLTFTFIFSIVLYSFFSSMPDIEHMSYDKLKRISEKHILSKLSDRRRKYRWTPINEVSRDYLYTLVMSEDGTFFEHKGVNFDAIMNSLAENIKHRSYDFGASTISQQVVKNLFLENTKSLSRKLKEILITQDLEKKFSKNQILEIYFNIAMFGPDVIGVRAASHTYFDKKPSRINAAEGAFIALMLPSPRRNHYAIFQNANLTKTRKKKIRRVLRDMLYKEFISAKQYRYYLRYRYFKGKRRDPSGRLKSRR